MMMQFRVKVKIYAILHQRSQTNSGPEDLTPLTYTHVQDVRHSLCICFCFSVLFFNKQTWRVLPLWAMSRAVSFPIPVLAPVMRTVFPSSLALLRHTPPAIHLRKASTPTPDKKDIYAMNRV